MRALWLGCVFMLLCPALAQAQTGASDDRVSLPEGPGSLEGVGENVTIDPNMGSMRYNVGINVPPGFGSVTPSLSLSYDSGGGGSVVGMGWSMMTPCIERMTYRGLPEYDTEDDFAVDGGNQLVRLPGTEPPVYRARFEGGFVRYTWLGQGDGSEGFWLAEWPNGSRGYFGADSRGQFVDDARVSGDEGTFRYHLVEMVDVYGHRMRYTYEKDGHVSLVSHIGYVFTEGPDSPTYEVEMSYEERRDETGVDYLGDAKAGFVELLTQRLTEIRVKSRGEVIRRYALTHEPYADTGGFTRLQKVEACGADDGLFPVAFAFEYSQSFGGESPYMMEMGDLGVAFGAGRATLLDINGDGLPDIVDASQSGPHRFYYNIAAADGTSAFATTPVFSEFGRQDTHLLGEASVQVLDLNGDGFTDLVNAFTGDVLVNQGSGDWTRAEEGTGMAALANALISDFDADEGELQNMKFIDYDNDKKIDVMRSTQFDTSIFRNMGEDGFEVDEQIEQLGVGFAEDGLQFADMNGDGLLDVVRVQPSTISYKLNLGWGRWSDYVTIGGLPISETQVEQAELEDLNGDGLADLVVVAGEAVTIALNVNTTEFADAVVFESADVEGIIPPRDSGTTVLYADMNANGSSDIVWISSNGRVQALDLFPARPNLMTRMTNNIGQVAEVTYTTSAVQMALDGGWEAMRHRLPYPMNIVQKLNQYELVNELHEETEYRYHDGFYDGIEKAFRGFERVEITGKGDDFIEEGLVALTYEVGAEDVYRKGLLLSSATTSAGRPLSLSETTYEDCPLDEVPEGTDLPIRFVCPTASRVTLQEGRPESEWAVTESISTYDGYGNVVRQAELGVTSIGGGGCEPCQGGAEEFGVPCGQQCLGDELYTETEYVSPLTGTDGRWIIHAPFREVLFGREGSDLQREALTYYDGPDFVGLPLGQLALGTIRRVTQKVETDSDRVIEILRARHDDHGMIVETLDPLGEPGGTTHRTRTTYDADNLRPLSEERFVEDPSGQPYTLVKTFEYEPRFDQAVVTSAWEVAVDGQVSQPRLSRFAFDEFGRVVSIAHPGDDLEKPTESFVYDLQSPVSRVIARRRVTPGGPLTLESISCIDGRGRTYQTRSKIEEGLYQVSGMTVFNVRSNPLRAYQPYYSESGECDLRAPQGVGFAQMRYDASARLIELAYPDEDLYGTASKRRNEFFPLAMVGWDPSDVDPDSPHADTPLREERNGLGLVTARVRQVSADAEPERLTFQYDSLGRVLSYADQQGNTKAQTYDLLDRVLSVVDPNTGGVMTFDYDDASNPVRSMDARGVIVNVDFDGMNRPVAQWDESDRDGTLMTFRYDTLPEGCDPSQCSHTPFKVSETTWPGLDGQRGVEQVGYDQRGRVLFRGWQMGASRFEWSVTHDDANRQTGVTYPDGRRIEMAYDGMDRIVGVEGLFDELVFDERGFLSQASAAHGVTTSWQRDSLGRMTAKETTGSDGTVLQGFGYTHDRVGRALAVEDLSELAGPSFEARYDYDGRTRLVEAQLGVEGSNEETLTYTYDSIDNFTARRSSLLEASPMHTGEHLYDPTRPNAVAQVDGMVMDYDLAGQMIQRGQDTFEWDHLGRLSVAETAQGTVTHRYGILGHRVARQHDGSTSLYAASDFVVRDGISQVYIKVGAQAARLESDALATAVLGDPVEDEQVNSADAWQASRDGDDARPFLWSSVRRLLLETGPDDGVTWLHTDHLGSYTMATAAYDGQVAVEGQRSFYPYGSVRTYEGYVDEFGFTGKEHDPGGLIYFGQRHYDPLLARWISPDPAFRSIIAHDGDDGTVAYAYVLNDPINSIDTDGLKTIYIALGFRMNWKNDDPYLENMRNQFKKAVKRIQTGFKMVNGKKTPTYADNPDVAVSVMRGGKNAGLGNLVEPNGPTTIVIGAHGRLNSDGMATHDKNQKFSTKQMVEILDANGLKPSVQRGKLIFKLQGCVTGSVSKVSDPKNELSTAERFAQELTVAGFDNFDVIGYNGFLVSSKSGSNKVTYNEKTHEAPPDGAMHDPDANSNFIKFSTKQNSIAVSQTGGTAKEVHNRKSGNGWKTVKPPMFKKSAKAAKK